MIRFSKYSHDFPLFYTIGTNNIANGRIGI